LLVVFEAESSNAHPFSLQLATFNNSACRAAATTMSKIDTFEELDCYQTGREFRRTISRWARTLPKEEQFRIKDQIIRSSRSITANIAEGFGRHHPQENLQFCRQSRGSLMETLEHLNTALDEDFLGREEYERMREQWNQVRALLSGYINYLQKLAPKDKRFL
jgi:four helix bundle protein